MFVGPDLLQYDKVLAAAGTWKDNFGVATADIVRVSEAWSPISSAPGTRELVLGSMTEKCAVSTCGFEWDAVGSDEVGPRMSFAIEQMTQLLRGTSGRASLRPDNATWSPVEYAGHVRDVLLNLRDRLVVAINEDNPLCKGLFGTSRIEMGLYLNDAPILVAAELEIAKSLFVRTWTRIPESFQSRKMVYGYPALADRSLRWVASQALHEVEHHLDDIRAGLFA